ncbi:MAG TPA: CDP-diacylglycerol--serine O-phosphatidyltransferase [Chthoniobacterales bacterium]
MSEESPKAYLLPNLMTSGNLVSGFAATLSILRGPPWQGASPDRPAEGLYWALGFILVACLFDLLDGPLARLRGQQNAFGREFDSLADLVSFGVAPALLVYRLVLQDYPPIGWVIASIYLLCGALRLARFNCAATATLKPGAAKDFEGLPIPVSAGLLASLVWCVLWLTPDTRQVGAGKFVLPPVMLFLSFMMLSRFRYPRFKVLSFRTRHPALKSLALLTVLIFTGLNFRWMPAALFLSYLLYGFLH